MQVVDVKDIKEHISAYLARVEAGETLVIARHDQPVAQLKPVRASRNPGTPRPIGLAKGMGAVPPAFFDPLPDDLLDLFE